MRYVLRARTELDAAKAGGETLYPITRFISRDNAISNSRSPLTTVTNPIKSPELDVCLILNNTSLKPLEIFYKRNDVAWPPTYLPKPNI